MAKHFTVLLGAIFLISMVYTWSVIPPVSRYVERVYDVEVELVDGPVSVKKISTTEYTNEAEFTKITKLLDLEPDMDQINVTTIPGSTGYFVIEPFWVLLTFQVVGGANFSHEDVSPARADCGQGRITINGISYPYYSSIQQLDYCMDLTLVLYLDPASPVIQRINWPSLLNFPGIIILITAVCTKRLPRRRSDQANDGLEVLEDGH